MNMVNFGTFSMLQQTYQQDIILEKPNLKAINFQPEINISFKNLENNPFK